MQIHISHVVNVALKKKKNQRDRRRDFLGLFRTIRRRVRRQNEKKKKTSVTRKKKNHKNRDSAFSIRPVPLPLPPPPPPRPPSAKSRSGLAAGTARPVRVGGRPKPRRAHAVFRAVATAAVHTPRSAVAVRTSLELAPRPRLSRRQPERGRPASRTRDRGPADPVTPGISTAAREHPGSDEGRGRFGRRRRRVSRDGRIGHRRQRYVYGTRKPGSRGSGHTRGSPAVLYSPSPPHRRSLAGIRIESPRVSCVHRGRLNFQTFQMGVRMLV